MKLFAFISIWVSSNAALAGSLPVILTQPQDLTNAGIFSVVATNATSYQWRCNGVDISGETNSALSRSSSDPTGYYLAIAKNDTGWVPSRLAYLTRGSGGLVPFSNQGNMASFAQACYGPYGGAQQYQPVTVGLAQVFAGPEVDQMQPVGDIWDFSGGDPGYFDDYDQVVPSVSPGQTVYYGVNVSFPYGGGTYTQPSSTLALVAGGGAYLTPSEANLKFPVWIEWPEPVWAAGTGTGTNLVLLPGENITLTEQYSLCGDFGMPTYQWRKDGQSLPGETNGVFYGYPYCGSASTTLSLTNVQAGDAGVYDVVVRGNRFLCAPKITLSVQISGGSGVFQSPRIVGTNFASDLTGAASRRYQIQWSSDLLTWNVLQTLTNTTGVVTFSSPVGSNSPQFYRSQLLP